MAAPQKPAPVVKDAAKEAEDKKYQELAKKKEAEAKAAAEKKEADAKAAAEKKAAEEEAGDKKKKKDKGGKGKKGKKGGGDDDDGGEKLLKVGPTEVVQKFDGFYEDYSNEWANRDETDNKDQQYDQ